MREALARIREVEIAPTTACNRRCWFCDPSIPHHQRTHPTHLALEVAYALADDLTGLGYSGLLIIAGLGEPTLHPECAEMVRGIRHRWSGGRIQMYTNCATDIGRVLLGEGAVDELIESLYEPMDRPPWHGRGTLSIEDHTMRRPETYHSRAGQVGPLLWPGRAERQHTKQCRWFRRKTYLGASGQWHRCCNAVTPEPGWGGPLLSDLVSNPQYLALRSALTVAPVNRAGLGICARCERPEDTWVPVRR